ncbi:MAG: ABC transporter substrate-binding protein [Elusimicrobia bacterium]|nr:ABC transporter substrate-binding protein [Elusimicrobiota bacterium]
MARESRKTHDWMMTPSITRFPRFAVLATLLLPFADARAADRPLRVGMAIPSYAHGVLWIAKDGGHFKNNRIDAEVLVLQGSADAMKLLIAGKVDVVLAGGDALIKADLAGADLAAFAGIVNTFYHRIVSRKDVLQPSDLRNKTIGLPILGGPQDMAVQVALKRWGLSYETDVKVRNMGAEYARLGAVHRGLVDAVTSDATPGTLAKLDLKVLGDVPSWNTPFPYMMAAARREFLDKNAALAESFLSSLLEAMEYYRTHEKESLAILAKHLSAESGADVDTSELYRQNGPATFTIPPYPDPAGFKTVLDFLAEKNPKAAKARPEDFFTNAFLDRATGRRSTAGSGGK